MINPPQVLPEEPTAVTPHGGFCGGDPAPEKTGSAENRNQSAMAGCAVCTIIFRHGHSRHATGTI